MWQWQYSTTKIEIPLPGACPYDGASRPFIYLPLTNLHIETNLMGQY